MILHDGLSGFPQWSPDGKKLYFIRNGELVERDLASGAERDVNRGMRGIGPLSPALSPDGQYYTAVRQDPSARTSSLLLVSVAGGQRELLRLTQPEEFGRRVWTSNSHAVIVEKNGGSASDGTYWPSRRELWLVPVAGGPPRKADIDTTIWTNGSMVPSDDGFSLSPDGRSIAFLTGKSTDEVWALENFLPAKAAKR